MLQQYIAPDLQGAGEFAVAVGVRDMGGGLFSAAAERQNGENHGKKLKITVHKDFSIGHYRI